MPGLERLEKIEGRWDTKCRGDEQGSVVGVGTMCSEVLWEMLY